MAMGSIVGMMLGGLAVSFAPVAFLKMLLAVSSLSLPEKSLAGHLE